MKCLDERPRGYHTYYFHKARLMALRAGCHRDLCGAVVVSRNGLIVGRGFNAPPRGDESQRQCERRDYDRSRKPNADLTCCVHAEWNALYAAVAKTGGDLEGAALYFMRVGDEGNFLEAGEPYCTVCSRLALQAGVDWFALWRDNNPQVYDARDYNLRSFEFHR